MGVWDWCVATGEQTHSERWEEMLGYAGDEVGPGYHEFISRVHPDDLARLRATNAAYLEGNATGFEIDLRMRCKDASWKWILSRGMVVSRDAQGRPWRMIGTHTDISERKQAEAELLELNRQLRDKTELLEATLASISQSITVIDGDGRVSAFNARVCELLELPASLLASRPTVRELFLYQAAGATSARRRGWSTATHAAMWMAPAPAPSLTTICV